MELYNNNPYPIVPYKNVTIVRTSWIVLGFRNRFTNLAENYYFRRNILINLLFIEI